MSLMRRNDRCVTPGGRRRGFTLIEILVVTVIMLILATVAFPSYQESVRKAKRAEGRAALLQVMQQQERYYSQNSSYIAFSSSSTDEREKRFAWHSGGQADESAYEIHATACENESIRNCVLLVATPGTTRVDSNYRDAKCGNLMLTSTGMKTASTDADGCWE